jgi:hypothetical protein
VKNDRGTKNDVANWPLWFLRWAFSGVLLGIGFAKGVGWGEADVPVRFELSD